jgi:hypothetical protein
MFFTGRMPVVVAGLLGFVVQAEVRAFLFDTPAAVPLMPMTSAAFILFTNYMIPDPATIPLKPWRQAAFGFADAMVYGVSRRSTCVWVVFRARHRLCDPRLSLHLYHAGRSRSPVAPQPAPAPLDINIAAAG